MIIERLDPLQVPDLVALGIDLQELIRILFELIIQESLLDPSDTIPEETESRRVLARQELQLSHPPAILIDRIAVLDDDIAVPAIEFGNVEGVGTKKDR